MKIYKKSSVKFPRIALCLQAIPVGMDWQLILSGGREHIGGTALARPGYQTQVSDFPDHKEGPVAEELAALLAEKLDCRVAFSCGIHYDDIAKEEIKEVLSIGRDLVNQFLLENGNIG